MAELGAPNLAALSIFIVCWLGYEPLLKALAGRQGGVINTDMTVIRTAWMRTRSAVTATSPHAC